MVAYSRGSNEAQIPVGERKSGMPLSGGKSRMYRFGIRAAEGRDPGLLADPGAGQGNDRLILADQPRELGWSVDRRRPAAYRANVILSGSFSAFAVGWLENLKPLGRYHRAFEAAGGILLILAGLYMLNAYFFIVPELAA